MCRALASRQRGAAAAWASDVAASKQAFIKPEAESSVLIEIWLIGSIRKQTETRKEKYLG